MCRLNTHQVSLCELSLLSLWSRKQIEFWLLAGVGLDWECSCVVVRTLNLRSKSCGFDSCVLSSPLMLCVMPYYADALSGNDSGQVVHTNVPLFTKPYYKSIHCQGFHANVLVMWQPFMDKGSIVVAVLQWAHDKNHNINHLLVLHFTSRPML